MRMPQLLAYLLATAGAASAAYSESFRFWPGKDAERVAGFERVSDHPCGSVATATVSKLPTASNGPLISEVVVELCPGGKVIRRWPMPVDYVPRALRGKDLLVAVGDEGFWVRSDGSFKRASHVPKPDQTPFRCNLESVFGKSDYAGCSVFVDLVSRKRRTLGYQGVCT